MDSKIVEVFDYKGHKCVVKKIEKRDDEYHCGYVQVGKGGSPYRHTDFVTDIDVAELTYSGVLDDVEGYFFGFDTDHLWNDKNPETKTKGSVKNRLKDLVEEFKEKDIFKKVGEESNKLKKAGIQKVMGYLILVLPFLGGFAWFLLAEPYVEENVLWIGYLLILLSTIFPSLTKANDVFERFILLQEAQHNEN